MATQTKDKPKTSTADDLGQPVLVTTEHRGVFFGYVSADALAAWSAGKSPTIEIKRMRNCIQWRGLHGFLALTTEGPSSACRVGPAAASGILAKITGIWNVEPKATDAWEAAPWAR